MAKRYYLDKLVQGPKGLRPSLLLSSEWAAETDGAYGVVQADNAQEGDDCLLVVNAKNHAALGRLPNVDLLPDFPLDSKVGSMHQATKVAMRARLVARGVAASVTDNADGYRDIIHHIGRVKLGHVNFDADNFDA